MNKFGLKPDEYQMLQLVDVPNIFTAICRQTTPAALSPPPIFRRRAKRAPQRIASILSKDGPEYVSVAIGFDRFVIKNNEG